jgi:hypothetical protein
MTGESLIATTKTIVAKTTDVGGFATPECR